MLKEFLLFAIHNLKRYMTNERGTWMAAAIVGGSAITAGAGVYSASQNGGKPGIEDNFVQGPNFQTGQDSTKAWWNQLQQDQASPDFGAISPDWNDIWQQTQQQVQNYFNGTATSPGVNDQIKSSFAQRGMGGDPAESYLLSASGANQAQELGNLSAQKNIAKQTFANEGKTQWLNSLQNLQQQTANSSSGGSWTGAQPYATPGQQIGNAIGAAGSGAMTYGINAINNKQQQDWLQSMLWNNTANPAGYAPAIEGAMG